MRHLRKIDTQTNYNNVKSSLALPNMCLLNDVYKIASEGDEDIIPVEYLQSTGTQYIDTGIKVKSNNVNISVKYQFTESATAVSVFGAMKSNNTCWFVEQYGNKWWIGGTGSLFSNSQGTNLHTVKWNIENGTVNGTVDNTDYSGTYSGSIVSDVTLALFCTHYGANYDRKGKVKLYYFQLSENGKKLLDLIPVRIGNVGYMFDNVSKKLFSNSGTGNFTLGQDIQVVEYLENISTSRIHTGISGNLRAIGYAVSNQIKGGSQCLICGNESGGWFGEAVSTKKWGITSSTGAYTTIAPTTPVNFDITFGTTVTGTINNENVSHSNYKERGEWAIFGSISGSYIFVGKLYWLKFYQNNILVRDFIPVKVNNVGYMYDKVSRQLFGNVGSGSFTCGPADPKRKLTRTK